MTPIFTRMLQRTRRARTAAVVAVTVAGTLSAALVQAPPASAVPSTLDVAQGAPQATLLVTSTAGTFGTPITLTTSGGSGTGVVTFSTTDGTATGCVVTARVPYSLIALSAGTCTVTATKAGDSADQPATSAPTAVTLAATPPSPPLGVSRTQKTVASGFRSAVGVAVDVTGALFVVDQSGNTIVKITPDGTRSDVGSGFSGPSGVAVDSAGNVYVADTGNARVERITPEGGQSTIGSGFRTPYGVAVDGAGNVYVTDSYFRNVSEITPSGSQFSIGSGFIDPKGVAVDSAGNVYVVDSYFHNVSEITPSGSQFSIGSGFTHPLGVAVDSAGNVYVSDANFDVADSYFRNVSEITPSGSQFVIGSGFGGPDGVAVDSAGNVYVADASRNYVYELVDAPDAAPSPAFSATITWAPPLFTGGETVIGYTATATDATTAANGGQSCTYTVTIPESDTCTVSGLTAGDSYTFTVTASNAAGASGPSSPSNPVTATKATQAPLTITPTSGAYGTPFPLSTSGGSGSGAVTFTAVDGTAAGCVVSLAAPYTLTSSSSGTCIVTATKAADSTYSAISSAPTVVALGLVAQPPLIVTSTSGTFGTPLMLVTSGGAGTGAVTFDAADGSASGCAITGIDPYTLGAATAGTCIVTATKAADRTYTAISSAPTTVTLYKAAQAPLTITTTSSTFGTPLPLSTSGGSGTGAVTFTTVDGTAAGCAVSGGASSTLTSSSAGTCTVTATKAGDGNYTSVSSDPTAVTLYKAAQAPLIVTSTSGTFGTPLMLVTSGGAGTGAVTFDAADGSASGCAITGIDPYTLGAATAGTCIVTAVKAGDAYYEPVSSAPTAVTFASGVPSPPLGAGMSGAIFASGFSDPQGVATDVDGNIYVADRIHNRIVEYSPAGAILRAVAMSAPMGVAVDAQGALYVARSNASQILKIGTDGTQTLIGGGFADPEGVAVDSAGNVYVTDDRYNNLSKIEPDGTQVGLNTFSSGPKGVTTDAAGNVYVVNPGASQVVRIQPDGTTSQYGPSFPDPRGVAIDGSGNMYVGDASASGSLYYATPAASSATLLATDLGNGDVFDALGPNGQLYVSVGYANVVDKFVRAPQASAVDATSASVTWAPPAFPRGTITSYAATATDATTPVNGGQSCSYTVADPESDSCTVTGLTTGDTYTFTVTATTSLATTSPPSAPTNPLTLHAAKSDQAPLTITSTSGTFGTDIALATSGGSGTGVVTFTAENGTATGCAVTGSTLSVSSAGTCTVTATKAGDADYAPVSSDPTTITFAKADQSPLTITSTTGTFGTGLALTTSGGSGDGAITFTASDVSASGCTVTGSTLSVTSAGTCTVTAIKAGDDDYLKVSSDPTVVTFDKAAQAPLTITSTTGTYGADLVLSTSGGSGTGAVTFVVADGTATSCAMSEIDPFTLTVQTAGTCTVTATKAGDDDYLKVSSDPTMVTFGKAAQAPLRITSTSGIYGTDLTLVTEGGSGSGSVSFTAVNGSASGCTVSGSTLTVTSAGTCTVTATRAGDDNYLKVSSDTTTVTFARAAQVQLTVTSTEGTLVADLTLTTSGGSGTGAVTFVVADGTATGCAIAEIDPFTLTAQTAGTCTVTATKAGDDDYLAVSSDPTGVTFSKAAQSPLTITSTTGTYGIDLALTTIGGSGSGAITFTAVNGAASGCAVTGSTLSVTSAGTCTVTATKAGDGTYAPESSDPTTVTFAKAAQAVLTITSTSGTYGFDLALTTSGGSGSGTVSFMAVDGSASGCAVTGSTLSVTSAGTCRVTATKAGDDNYLAVSSDQTIVTFARTDQAPLKVTSTSGTYGTDLALTTSGGSGDGAITFTAVNGSASGCRVSGSTLSVTSAGTCTVTATKAGDDDYLKVSSDPTTVTFTETTKVGQAPLTITSTSGTYGTDLALTTEGGSGDGAVTFTAVDGTAPGCAVTGSTLSVASAGTCTVTATKAGDDDYLKVSSDPTTVTLDPAPITVTVTGNQTYGSATATFDYTANLPAGVTFSGTVSCTAVEDGTAITPSLPVGKHTIDGSGCAGLAVSSNNFVPTYFGGTFTVSQAATGLLYTGGQTVVLGKGFSASAVLSSAAGTCVAGQTVAFTLDSDPTGGTTSSSYSLGSANSGSGGTAGLSVSTSNWQDGVYTMTASFAGTRSCTGSTDQATLTVAAPGDASTGGGWYTLPGSGRVNFGFVVHQVPHSDPVAYTGNFLLINNGKWRLKGGLDSYVATDGQGSVSGTADLYWWNSALNGGLGDWQLAASGIAFTASFTVTIDGKHAANRGSMGVHIDYTPVSPQPPALPNSAPQPLKGGQISATWPKQKAVRVASARPNSAG